MRRNATAPRKAAPKKKPRMRRSAPRPTSPASAGETRDCFLLEIIITVLNQKIGVFIQILKHDARPTRNSSEWVIRDMNRNFHPFGQQNIKTFNQSPYADQIDAVFHNIGKNFRRGRFKYFTDGFNERVYGLRNGFANIRVGKHDLARKARNQVTAADNRFK